MEQENNDFILIPAKGGGGLVRRSEIAGGRPNGAEGSIVYLKSGPSVYSTASMPQIARYLGAEVVQVRES